MTAQTAISASSRRWSDVAMYGAITVWAVVIATGWVLMQRYDFAVHAPYGDGYVTEWPDACSVPHNPDGPTLVLFMHPKCPCTRATILELERMFTHVSKSMPATSPRTPHPAGTSA